MRFCAPRGPRSCRPTFTIGGGVPIVVNGRVVGALGVSAATPAEDAAIAAATVGRAQLRSYR